MDDSVKKFQARRDARLKKRREDDWITMKGTHVLLDDDGNISKGPQRLKDRNKETNWTQRYKTKSNKPVVVHVPESKMGRGASKMPNDYSFESGGKTWNKKTLTKMWQDRGYGKRYAESLADRDLKEHFKATHDKDYAEKSFRDAWYS